MKLRTFALAAALLGGSAAATGCGGHKQSWYAQPLLGTPVRVVVGRAVTDGNRLYVEAMVTNSGDRTMTIDRNGVTVLLDDGRVIGRSVGITSTKQPYVLEPGRTRAVHVDFRAEGFKWRKLHHVALDWSNAVSIEGKTVQIPPMSLEASEFE